MIRKLKPILAFAIFISPAVLLAQDTSAPTASKSIKPTATNANVTASEEAANGEAPVADGKQPPSQEDVAANAHSSEIPESPDKSESVSKAHDPLMGERRVCLKFPISSLEEKLKELPPIFTSDLLSDTDIQDHYDYAKDCAQAAAAASSVPEGKASGCYDVYFEWKSDETALPADKLQERFCDHYVKLNSIGGEQLQKTYEYAQAGKEWLHGDAQENFRNYYSDLKIHSEKLIKDSGSESLLKSCSANANELDKLLKKLLGESGEVVKVASFEPIDNFQSCIDKEDGLFLPYKGNKDNWSFFEFPLSRDERLVGSLNKKKVCKEHAQYYCAPAIEFYNRCAEVDSEEPAAPEGAKGKSPRAACEEKAKDTLKSCIAGSYQGEVPKILVDEDSNGHLNGYFKGGRVAESGWITVSQFNQLALNVKKEELDDFAYVFHEMYGTCSILRAASAAMADEEGKAKLDQQAILAEGGKGGGGSCVRTVPWTADFKYCALHVRWGDGLGDVAAAGAETGIAIKTAMNQSSINQKVAEKAAEGDQAAFIDGQRSTYKRSAENATIRSGLAGTHATYLFGVASKFPSMKKFSTACSEELDGYYGAPALNCGVAWVLDRHPRVPVRDDVHGKTREMMDATFSNQAVRERFFMKSADKMTDSIFQGIVASQRNKQASDLGKIKRQFDDFFTQEAVGPEYVGVNYCKQNPGAPSCRDSGRTRQEGAQTTFGTIGVQNQGGGNFAFHKLEDGFEEDEKISAEERKARERLTSIMDQSSGSKSSGGISAPGEAKAKYGSAGGGGGGGAAGAAGGGGGGMAPAPNKPEQKVAEQGMTKSAAEFVSGSSSSYQAGRSAPRQKKTNAFQDMFNSKKPSRNVATVVEDIAPAQSQLFEKISKAYSKASQDRRLYEFDGE